MSNKLEEKDPQTNCTQNVEAFYKKKKSIGSSIDL